MRRIKSLFSRRGEYFDYTLLIVVIFLIVFGLIMIYSTSSYVSSRANSDSGYYLKHQLLAVVVGFFAASVISLIDYHFWSYFSFAGTVVAVVLIGLVVTPLGMELNGARRWLKVGPLSFQPAEFAKIATIVLCAVLLNRLTSKSLKTLNAFIYVLFGPGVMALMLYVITDNLSSAIIVAGIAAVMIFVADYDHKKYLVLSLAVAVIGVLLVYAATHITSGGFRLTRIRIWLDPQSDAKDKGYQTLQALYAIGSGGLFGKGLGGSMQKLGTLPEAQNDMIFSIVCEELGMVGAIAIMGLFLVLVWRCFVIANNAPDLFGTMIVIGVMAHFAIQVILNIAVVTNSMPNTGISLPFISYGGTSEIFLMAEIGLVLNVSWQIGTQEEAEV